MSKSDTLPFLGRNLVKATHTSNNGNTRIFTLDIALFQKIPVIEGVRGEGFCPLAHGL